jgi:hypothetical protein
MNQSISTEAAYNLGAEAMRSKVSAFLVMHGQITLAGKVLALSNPKFEIPEQQLISTQDVGKSG